MAISEICNALVVALPVRTVRIDGEATTTSKCAPDGE
jgi:hypothetical protein